MLKPMVPPTHQHPVTMITDPKDHSPFARARYKPLKAPIRRGNLRNPNGIDFWLRCRTA